MFSGVRAETEGDPILVSPRRSIVELRLLGLSYLEKTHLTDKNYPTLRTPIIYRVYKGSLDGAYNQGYQSSHLAGERRENRVR